jgi:hypothetical protein
MKTRITKALRGATFRMFPRLALKVINGLHVMVVASG